MPNTTGFDQGTLRSVSYDIPFLYQNKVEELVLTGTTMPCLFVETKYATIAHQDDYYEPNYAEKVLWLRWKKTFGCVNWVF